MTKAAGAGGGGNEAVKVIVRCRPMNKREIGMKCKNVVHTDGPAYVCAINNPNEPNSEPKSFTFDGVYGTNSTTEAIYNDNGFDLVEGVLEGYNGTVFAYGQTGCGKSFSMQGITDPPTQRGIIPRAFEQIFEAIDTSENMKYLVHASYLEIYNEEIRDLLGNDIKKKLDLKEHPDQGVYVQNISLHAVQSTQECEDLMEKGWGNRATGATKMNADSSRSHSIFTINIEMMSTGAGDSSHIRKGKLNLVDLAGSERQSKTEATGDRLKEATKINLSLSALGNVISALVDGKSKHIPYRDSKLTRLLQDSLGGNTKTMMVACLSPADNNYEETLSTLRYANRAKNIKNKPKINEDPKDAMLREYQSEIEKLKQMIEKGGFEGGEVVPSEELLEAERERVRSEYEAEMAEMREKFSSEQQSKAKMAAEIEELKRDYEDKLKEVNERAKTASESRKVSSEGGTTVAVGVGDAVPVANPINPNLNSANPATMVNGVVHGDIAEAAVNQEQLKAMEKLRRLQASLLDGGKRADDKDLKEKRLKKKKAAEKRLKVLGEALGHVDDEDGVLVKVYDDIQTELAEKTQALKKMKQRVKGLNAEINDIQSEFEKDRQDYLDSIRKQDQQIKLLDQILEKVQPTLRKDCNYSNLEKIRSEAAWSEERQTWKLPDLIVQKTKLPPAGPFGGSLVFSGDPNPPPEDAGGRRSRGPSPARSPLSRTAPGRLEQLDQDDEEDTTHLKKKLAKSEQEDVVGNYFKPARASRLMAQAQETQRAVNLGPRGSLGAAPSAGRSGLAASYNSGLNTSGMSNNYNGGGTNSSTWGPSSTGTSWLDSGGSGPGTTYGGGNSGGGGLGGLGGTSGPPSFNPGSTFTGGSSYGPSFAGDIIRKPSRLEALPSMDRKANQKKKSVPMLNTMGTF